MAQIGVAPDRGGQLGLFVLQTNGDLYEYGPAAWTFLDSHVAQIGVAQDRAVRMGLFVLETNGYLFELTSNGLQRLDRFVKAISTNASGQLQVNYTPIGQKWAELGREAGVLGLPTSDELDVPGGASATSRAARSIGRLTPAPTPSTAPSARLTPSTAASGFPWAICTSGAEPTGSSISSTGRSGTPVTSTSPTSPTATSS